MKAAISTAPRNETTPADPEATAAAEARTGSTSPVVRFAKRFEYTWPSRAVTDFPAGYEGRVKVEVAEAAKAAGVLDDTGNTE
jgi:hypothetical protein